MRFLEQFSGLFGFNAFALLAAGIFKPLLKPLYVRGFLFIPHLFDKKVQDYRVKMW